MYIYKYQDLEEYVLEVVRRGYPKLESVKVKKISFGKSTYLNIFFHFDSFDSAQDFYRTYRPGTFMNFNRWENGGNEVVFKLAFFLIKFACENVEEYERLYDYTKLDDLDFLSTMLRIIKPVFYDDRFEFGLLSFLDPIEEE